MKFLQKLDKMKLLTVVLFIAIIVFVIIYKIPYETSGNCYLVNYDLLKEDNTEEFAFVIDDNADINKEDKIKLEYDLKITKNIFSGDSCTGIIEFNDIKYEIIDFWRLDNCITIFLLDFNKEFDKNNVFAFRENYLRIYLDYDYYEFFSQNQKIFYKTDMYIGPFYDSGQIKTLTEQIFYI